MFKFNISEPVKIKAYDHIYTGIISLRTYTEDAMRSRVTYEVDISSGEIGGTQHHVVSEDHLLLWQQL